jgi:archaellum biogenesis ATPase FlaH
MESVSYLKEVLVNLEKTVSLVLLNQKQFRTALDFVLGDIVKREKQVVFVSFTKSGDEIIRKFGSDNLTVIDGFSKEQRDTNNIIYIGNKTNLTNVQIAIEKVSGESEKIIVFDSLSVMSIYNSKRDLGKFVYLFNNKISLEGNTCLYFATKESIDEETVETVKQFCDKTYDFSDIYISSIHVN